MFRINMLTKQNDRSCLPQRFHYHLDNMLTRVRLTYLIALIIPVIILTDLSSTIRSTDMS